MIQIPVKRRRRGVESVVGYAIVDDDMGHLAAYRWGLNSGGYAERTDTTRRHRKVAMHHDVVGRIHGKVVSHKNAVKLDNRRHNLEHCTTAENRQNPADPPLRSKKHKAPRGIFYDSKTRSSNKWRGKVEVLGVAHRTRRCASEREAAILLGELRRSLGLPVLEEVRDGR